MNLNYSYNIFFFLLSVNPCLSQKSSLLTYIIIAVGIELWMALIKLPSPGKKHRFYAGSKVTDYMTPLCRKMALVPIVCVGLRISAPWTVGKVPPILHQSIWHPSQNPTLLPPHHSLPRLPLPHPSLPRIPFSPPPHIPLSTQNYNLTLYLSLRLERKVFRSQGVVEPKLFYFRLRLRLHLFLNFGSGSSSNSCHMLPLKTVLLQ